MNEEHEKLFEILSDVPITASDEAFYTALADVTSQVTSAFNKSFECMPSLPSAFNVEWRDSIVALSDHVKLLTDEVQCIKKVLTLSAELITALKTECASLREELAAKDADVKFSLPDAALADPRALESFREELNSQASQAVTTNISVDAKEGPFGANLCSINSEYISPPKNKKFRNMVKDFINK